MTIRPIYRPPFLRAMRDDQPTPWENITKAELVEACKEAGLSSSGTKEELYKRLHGDEERDQ